MIAWMLYVALIGGVVALAGWAVERLAVAAGWPRRFVWLAALTLAVAIPVAGTIAAARSAESPSATESPGAPPAATAGTQNADAWNLTSSMPLPTGPEAVRAALALWGAGTLASLTVIGTLLILVARARRRWPRTWIADTDVYVSRSFGPALVGVVRPSVVVPSWVLQLKQRARAVIIRHETEHARTRDHLSLLYGGLVVAALPWSPATWWMARRLRSAVEMDCDQRILRSGVAAADYGDVLLDAGARSWSRWALVPAMTQPKSLLERRLKTMSEKKTKLNTAQALLLAALAVGALAVACDTPVPTQVQDALIEAMDEEQIARTEAEAERRAEELLRARASGMDPAPLIYIDGVRVDRLSDLDGVRIPSLDPDAIDRVEVIKGPAARTLYGEEAANGLIQIFLREGGAEGAEGDGPLKIRVKGDGPWSGIAVKEWVSIPTRAKN